MSAATTSADAGQTAAQVTEGVWDLLVIGGGSAGLVGARTAASFGASVLLVERDRTGGDCLWTGCVPSKALLAAAGAAAGARTATRFGIHTGPVTVDFGQVMCHVRAAIAAIEPVDSTMALRAAGVRVVSGTARFTGPDHVHIDSAHIDGSALGVIAVGGVPVRFRQALIATGSAPLLPPIPGLAEAAALTSDTIWDLDTLPERLVVLGGGSVGCELGQAFARLGANVTLIESAPRLLPGEDPDAAALLTVALRRDGVTVRTGAPVTAMTRHDAGNTIVTADGATVEADEVLVASGRRPDTAALDPAAAGVELDGRGFVTVNARLRTSNPRIWAAGGRHRAPAVHPRRRRARLHCRDQRDPRVAPRR